MQRLKKIVLVSVLAAVLALYFYQANLIRAQEVSTDNLQFCVDAGKIYFFQPQTGRIFVYQGTTNRFNRLLTLEALGEDLKQSRSLSVIELEP